MALFREKLQTIAGDRCVVALVIRIDTPAGGVNAGDLMGHELEAFRRQWVIAVVASTEPVGRLTQQHFNFDQ